MVEHPFWLIIVDLDLGDGFVKSFSLMFSEPCKGTTQQTQRFPCACWRFEYANTACVNAIIECLHELLLDAIRHKRMMKVFGRHGHRSLVVFKKLRRVCDMQIAWMAMSFVSDAAAVARCE
jgi:hypothetical protein